MSGRRGFCKKGRKGEGGEGGEEHRTVSRQAERERARREQGKRERLLS